METSIAFCGLNCETCPIHLATLEADKSHQQSMRESISELCSAQYGMRLQPEDITDCDGCRTNFGRLFSGCLSCEISKCAIHKNLESCAWCSDYACSILQKHFLLDPDAKVRLEEIRQAKNDKQ